MKQDGVVFESTNIQEHTSASNSGCGQKRVLMTGRDGSRLDFVH